MCPFGTPPQARSGIVLPAMRAYSRSRVYGRTMSKPDRKCRRLVPHGLGPGFPCMKRTVPGSPAGAAPLSPVERLAAGRSIPSGLLS
jgi:hypothetical protein